MDLASLDDNEVVRLTVERDKNHFAEIVGRYERPIFAYLLRLLSFNRQDAEDVTAETFLKAFVNLRGFNRRLKFSSWLYRIAHNEAVNLIKKKSKTYNIDVTEVEIPTNIDFDKPNREDLEKILSRLSFDDRNLLTLFYLEELSIREIAEIYKLTEGNIKVKLNRARGRAKDLAQPQYAYAK
jgi:RNA polymerase sigma-70 factor (ECF subfamily)